MNLRTITTTLLFIVMAMLAAAPSGARLIVPPIEGPIVKKVVVAVPDLFAVDTEKDPRAKEFADVLRHDLTVSGLFEVRPSPVPVRGEIDFDTLFEQGIDALVKGEYRSKNGRIEVAVRLYSVVEEKPLVGRFYDASTNRVREAAHRFANLTLKELTGIEGFYTSKIVYVGAASKSRRDLFIMDYDGMNVRRLTSHNALVLSPNCSRKGDKVVFNSDKVWDQDIYVLYLIPRIREVRLTRGFRLDQSPAWSPDGTKIAFSAGADIYVADADGRNGRNLTRSHHIEVSPTWSPDGTKIAFVSDKTGSPKIYVMNADGSNQRLITPHGYNTDPAWSPNPNINKIAFVRVEGSEANIFTINPDGTGEERLTWAWRRNENPSWSSDGHWITFASNRDGAYDIYMMYLNGSNTTRLTRGGGKLFPTWCR